MSYTCQLTQTEFELAPDETAAFAASRLPLPEVNPEERLRRLLVFRNLNNFFWRQCDQSGERIYSPFPPSLPFPVYRSDLWWNGTWDPLSPIFQAGAEQAFFSRFISLLRAVPRPEFHGRNVEGCVAVEYCFNVRDCLFLGDAMECSGCCYGTRLFNCQGCIDCLNLEQCSFCYESLCCRDSDYLRFAENCARCHDCWFVSNCTDCANCFFCSNLNGASYCIFNEPVSKENYQAILASHRLHFRPGWEAAAEAFAQFLKRIPVPSIIGTDGHSCSGNYLFDCHSSHNSFYCDHARDIYGSFSLWDATRCLDVVGFGAGLTDSAQSVSVGLNARRVVNCVDCWGEVSDLMYCVECHDSANLLGCVGLKQREYCILNQQLRRRRYFIEKNKIEKTLRESGGWGRALPGALSPFPYNFSEAFNYMPLTAVQAELLEFAWNDELGISATQLLRNEAELKLDETPVVLDDLLQSNGDRLYICELSGQPFGLYPLEIELYRRLGVPPPSRSFKQRHADRLRRLSPCRLIKRRSSRAADFIFTAFPENWRQPVIDYQQWQQQVAETLP